ncbi:histidine kinase [Paucibacter sediminis]|uniref:Histidine kinase n=1 Tax=Paucibacter sediminis TaxID=3019553 RepID=A0AA95NDH0_9BURK|nr:histidine kinase [Paucibacter sp. S2-9]WIT13047.1 histidine kinase [Paucibacter sp. S2-9]
MTHRPDTLDWTQWICPGPRRRFSALELRQAGAQPWPRGIDHYVYSNTLILAAVFYNELPRGLGLWVLLASLCMSVASLLTARWLWRQPTRKNLNLASWGAVLVSLVLIFGLAKVHGKEMLRFAAPVLVAGITLVLSAWWFLTLYRVQQIEARLRELADQEASQRLARRLATAQIQPHFLFNTLASLQHWVDTQDSRAAGMLRSFTRYLRATLPMFEHESLPLGQELQIVASYLEVMQARLGARLAWRIEAAPELQDLTLPPGALLTLVENAIGHGIEPALRGGRIDVRAYREGAALRLEVQDDGAGLCAETASDDGLGLTNTRERLQQLYGARASLQLLAQEPGCLARITIHDEGEQRP